MSSAHAVGERLSYDGALCTVRYVGEVVGTAGSWLGVEWDDPSRGKHNGQHKGVRYFDCKIQSPIAASFVRPTRPVDQPLDFLSALSEKYASEMTHEQVPIASKKQIVISGKVAEEVGFDKIRREQAQLGELKIVILDAMRVASAYALASPSLPAAQSDGHRTIMEVCPKVTELDLSRNLFTRFGTVVGICSELGDLRSLRINGNRLNTVLLDYDLQDAEAAFEGVKELAMGEMLLEWEDICRIASKFPALNSLLAGTNGLSTLSPIPPSGLTSTLTSLNLEFNEFTSFSDIEALTDLASLRNLHLKGNSIATIVDPSNPSAEPPVFTTNLRYLDLSYNQVSTWPFTDALPTIFPGLTSFRFSHNPIYDNPDLDTLSSPDAGGSAPQAGKPAPPTDESYMLTLGRLPGLRALNFSTVTAADRTNADIFYLSRIARQLAAAPADSGESAAVLARHRRWAELCDAYGEPVVVRRRELDPNFLEARLVGVEFYLARAGGPAAAGPRERTAGIPKSFDIYAVKGIAGRLFGLSPLRLRLVWETGEWDPVAGFDEEDGDSSDEAELEAEMERKAEEVGSDEADADEEVESQSGPRAGRWVKREVELKDGPRQFGYCVEGLEARIRVEVK